MAPWLCGADFKRGGSGGRKEGRFVEECFGALGDEVEGDVGGGEWWWEAAMSGSRFGGGWRGHGRGAGGVLKVLL